MTAWYTIRAATSDVTDVEITGPIHASTAPEFLRALPSRGALRLHVNSLGGDPGAALTIASALRGRHERVEVTIGQIAASAASLIPCGAHRVTVASDSVVMIHAPRMVPDEATPLTPRRLRAAASELERVRDRMAEVYAWKLKGGRDAAGKLVDDEDGVWLDAAEAVRCGLADQIAPAGPAVAARFDPSALAALGRVPARFAARVAALGHRPSTISHREIWRNWNAPAAPALNSFEIYRARNHRGAKS